MGAFLTRRGKGPAAQIPRSTLLMNLPLSDLHLKGVLRARGAGERALAPAFRRGFLAHTSGGFKPAERATELVA